MIGSSTLELSPDINIKLTEFYSKNKQGFMRMKFPVVIQSNGNRHPINIAREIFSAANEDKTFCMCLYHMDDKREKYVNCNIERLSVNVDTGDYIEMTLLISGDLDEHGAPIESPGSLIPTKVVDSKDCVLDIVNSDSEEFSVNRIYNFCFFMDREDPRIHGAFKVLNSFIGDSGITMAKQINSFGEAFINFGYKTTNSSDPDWIVNIIDAEIKISERDIRKGLDLVEVAFVGKREY